MLHTHGGHIKISSGSGANLKIGPIRNNFQTGLESDTHLSFKANNGAGNFYWYRQDVTQMALVDGNLGIGTTLPSEKLDINGNLAIRHKKVLDLSNNNLSRGPFNPIIAAIRNSGKCLRLDTDFSDGLNGIVVYNNHGGDKVTINRRVWNYNFVDPSTPGIAGTGFNDTLDDVYTWMSDNGETDNYSLGVPNSSGYVLHIKYDGTGDASTVTPHLGGFYQTYRNPNSISSVYTQMNHTYVQIFKALVPVGYKLYIHEDHLGNDKTTYWLTDDIGTGKWEWYGRINHIGSSTTSVYSAAGHIAIAPTTAMVYNTAVDWFLASCTVYDVTEADAFTHRRIGVGTIRPDKELEVIGDISASADIYAQNFYGTASYADTASYALNAGNSLWYDGSSYISSSTDIQVNGNISASGNITASDIRVENDVQVSGDLGIGGTIFGLSGFGVTIDDVAVTDGSTNFGSGSNPAISIHSRTGSMHITGSTFTFNDQLIVTADQTASLEPQWFANGSELTASNDVGISGSLQVLGDITASSLTVRPPGSIDLVTFAYSSSQAVGGNWNFFPSLMFGAVGDAYIGRTDNATNNVPNNGINFDPNNAVKLGNGGAGYKNLITIQDASVARPKILYNSPSHVFQYDSTNIMYLTESKAILVNALITGSLEGTASYASTALTASYATTSSHAVTALTALTALNVQSSYATTITINGDSDKYYQVVIKGGDQNRIRELNIYRSYAEAAPDDWNNATHKGGLTAEFRLNAGGWGGAEYDWKLLDFRESYSTMLADAGNTNWNKAFYVMLRGGGALYHIDSDDTLGDIQIVYGGTSELTFDHASDGHDVYGLDPVTEINVTNLKNHTIQKHSENLDDFWHADNDGSGSGLDADKLDGQHGSHYLNYDNLSNTPSIPQGTVTQVSVGTGLDVSTGTTTPNITLDLDEFTQISDNSTLVNTDELIVMDSSVHSRIGLQYVKLSLFDNDLDLTALSIANDSIGDTQLAYNTGQHLATGSTPSFEGLVISDGDGDAIRINVEDEVDASIRFVDNQAAGAQDFEITYNASSESLRFRHSDHDPILTLTNAGRVGIGTDAPDKILTIADRGTANSKLVFDVNTSSPYTCKIGITGAGWVFNSNASADRPIKFNTGNNTRLAISDTKIESTVPIQGLEIQGKLLHYTYHHYYSSDDPDTIPFTTDDEESDESETGNNPNFSKIIAPHDGVLKTVYIKADKQLKNTQISLQVNGGYPGTLTMHWVGTNVTTFAMNSNNAFTKGDMIGVHIDPDNSSAANITVTCVWEYDTRS